jgi:CRP-like cAMP-binding protein
MDDQVAIKVDNFFIQFKYQQYKKGEIIVRAEEEPQGIFYLKEGKVKMYTISKKGDEIVVNLFRPISFFPMSWAINKTHNRYYYEAVTDAEIFLAPKDKTLAFIKVNPDVLYNLLSRVYKGIDGIFERMSYLMKGNAYDRLITEILIAARRFGANDNKKLIISITEEDLASQAGLTRETVSREMKILKDKNLLTFHKRTIVINNIEMLEKELYIS